MLQTIDHLTRDYVQARHIYENVVQTRAGLDYYRDHMLNIMQDAEQQGRLDELLSWVGPGHCTTDW